jgi:hypothetical protein
MTDLVNFGSTLELPRGVPGTEPLRLDMLKINLAENRLSETRSVNIGTMAELVSVFNESCNLTTKYIAWVKYELLKAEKEFDLAKAAVIIDQIPAIVKERGIKDNADFRDAMVNRDQNCDSMREIILHLKAAQTFLEAKAKSFERAYWDCRDNIKRNTSNPALPNYNNFQNPSSADTQPRSDQAPSFIGTTKF